MKFIEIPLQEQLPTGERLIRAGRYMLDLLYRGLPCTFHLQPFPSRYNDLRLALEQLETVANNEEIA